MKVAAIRPAPRCCNSRRPPRLAPDATLTARTFVFHDNPSRCGNQPLTLFNGAVVIPPYLCGHPDFVVIETSTSGVEVPSGTIDVENLTAEVLPNNLFGCNSVRQNPAGAIDPDPSHRDVVAWQTTNPQEMLETDARHGPLLRHTRRSNVRMRQLAWQGRQRIVPLRRPAHSSGRRQRIRRQSARQPAELRRPHPLQAAVLQASVVESKEALPKLSYAALKALVDTAIEFHDRGRYKAALTSIKVFRLLVEHTKYKVIAGENFNGDHIMRASNLEFVYTAKVIPVRTVTVGR